jgi:DNA-binding XRE family transcriptional regulator
MTAITFNVPDSINVTELTKALMAFGIVPDIDELDDDATVPYEIAMAMAFPDMTPQELAGSKLKITRQEAKLTQKKLAEMVGEDAANISAMERGKRAISRKMANKLAKALNVTYLMFL